MKIIEILKNRILLRNQKLNESNSDEIVQIQSRLMNLNYVEYKHLEEVLDHGMTKIELSESLRSGVWCIISIYFWHYIMNNILVTAYADVQMIPNTNDAFFGFLCSLWLFGSLYIIANSNPYKNFR